MTEFKIEIAEVVFKVVCLYESTREFCKEYLSEKVSQHCVEIKQDDIEFERKLSLFKMADQYLETLALYRKITELLIEEDVILFHCSAIEMDKKAYLFSGPSGIGKSTHVRMWREVFAEKNIHMINDDKPLIRFKEDGEYVYGTPWNGKGRLSENRGAPIQGVCFLSQGKENEIGRLSESEAFPLLLKQTYRSNDKNRLTRTIKLLQRMAIDIPVYKMTCNISHEAAIKSYNCMRG